MNAPNDRELKELRTRIGRLEIAGWIERGLLALLIYVAWDTIPSMVRIIGGVALGMTIVFSIVERVRAL